MKTSKEKVFKDLARMAFVFFCLASLCVIGVTYTIIHALFSEKAASHIQKDADITSFYVGWALSFAIWLGLRWYHRLLLKNKNKI